MARFSMVVVAVLMLSAAAVLPLASAQEAPTCDADSDGYEAATSACGGSDCNDDDRTVHPGASDPAGDGVDQDCDGTDGDPCDADGDGHASTAPSCGGRDCDDHNRSIYPGASDPAGDGVDQDCDGADGGPSGEGITCEAHYGDRARYQCGWGSEPCDLDHDGTDTRQEHARCLSGRWAGCDHDGRVVMTAWEVDACFHARALECDLDGDGVASEPELGRCVHDLDVCDADADGTTTDTELDTCAQPDAYPCIFLGDPPARSAPLERCGLVRDRCDRDADAVLTSSEWSGCGLLFDACDADLDGHLSVDERRSCLGPRATLDAECVPPRVEVGFVDVGSALGSIDGWGSDRNGTAARARIEGELLRQLYDVPGGAFGMQEIQASQGTCAVTTVHGTARTCLPSPYQVRGVVAWAADKIGAAWEWVGEKLASHEDPMVDELLAIEAMRVQAALDQWWNDPFDPCRTLASAAATTLGPADVADPRPSCETAVRVSRHLDRLACLAAAHGDWSVLEQEAASHTRPGERINRPVFGTGVGANDTSVRGDITRFGLHDSGATVALFDYEVQGVRLLDEVVLSGLDKSHRLQHGRRTASFGDAVVDVLENVTALHVHTGASGRLDASCTAGAASLPQTDEQRLAALGTGEICVARFAPEGRPVRALTRVAEGGSSASYVFCVLACAAYDELGQTAEDPAGQTASLVRAMANGARFATVHFQGPHAWDGNDAWWSQQVTVLLHATDELVFPGLGGIDTPAGLDASPEGHLGTAAGAITGQVAGVARIVVPDEGPLSGQLEDFGSPEPRESASALATGRRQHSPITFSTPSQDHAGRTVQNLQTDLDFLRTRAGTVLLLMGPDDIALEDGSNRCDGLLAGDPGEDVRWILCRLAAGDPPTTDQWRVEVRVWDVEDLRESGAGAVPTKEGGQNVVEHKVVRSTPGAVEPDVREPGTVLYQVDGDAFGRVKVQFHFDSYSTKRIEFAAVAPEGGPVEGGDEASGPGLVALVVVGLGAAAVRRRRKRP